MYAEDYKTPDGELGVGGTKLNEGDILRVTIEGKELECVVSYDPPVTLKIRELIPNSIADLVLSNPFEQLAFLGAVRV